MDSQPEDAECPQEKEATAAKMRGLSALGIKVIGRECFEGKK